MWMYTCVSVCACMCVCMCICARMSVCGCKLRLAQMVFCLSCASVAAGVKHASTNVLERVSVYITFMDAEIDVCRVDVSRCVWMYTCVSLCVRVCMYVCMYVLVDVSRLLDRCLLEPAKRYVDDSLCT